jgi:hypothetical protein
VRVFLLFHYFLITQKEKLTERKTGTPVFPLAFVQEPKALETSHELSARGLFQTACDSCVGDKPEQSTTTQEKCDSRRFAIIRGGISHLSTPRNTLSELD